MKETFSVKLINKRVRAGGLKEKALLRSQPSIGELVMKDNSYVQSQVGEVPGIISRIQASLLFTVPVQVEPLYILPNPSVISRPAEIVDQICISKRDV
jgi:hypothetical protein